MDKCHRYATTSLRFEVDQVSLVTEGEIAFVVVVVLVSVSVGLVSIDVGKAREVREALETTAGTQ